MKKCGCTCSHSRTGDVHSGGAFWQPPPARTSTGLDWLPGCCGRRGCSVGAGFRRPATWCSGAGPAPSSPDSVAQEPALQPKRQPRDPPRLQATALAQTPQSAEKERRGLRPRPRGHLKQERPYSCNEAAKPSLVPQTAQAE